MNSVDVHDLTFSFGSRKILDGISFSVKEGTMLSVLGPNGVGKSTLFRCMLGTAGSYCGKISFFGRDANTLSRKDMASLVAYIPQVHRPTFGYSVLDTVLMGAAHMLSPLERPSQKHIENALAAMERIGVMALKDRDFSQLSGGEQQLVLVARAVSQNSRILLMDEPTSSLDYGNQIRVLELIRTLADEGYTVILSTHNPQHALTFSDQVVALKNCHVAADGMPNQVINETLMQELYGIETFLCDTRYGKMITPLRKEI